MEASTECFDALICSGARRLTGYQPGCSWPRWPRNSVKVCRQAERRFGWGRETVLKGLHERVRDGCLENFVREVGCVVKRGTATGCGHPCDRRAPYLRRSGTEVVAAVHELSAAEVRQALIDKGHSEEELPSERTMRDILNRMNYRLKRIQKGKPLKKTKETDAIFANVKEVREQARNEPETLEISMDTKAKVGLGDYARGGKTRTAPTVSGQGMGSRSASQGETGPFRHRDAGDRGVDAPVRITRDQRRLGRCAANVVAAGSVRLRACQAPGDLSGQRPQELRSADPVSETDGPVCRLVAVGDSVGVLSPYHSKYNPIERCWSALEKKWNGVLLNCLKVVLHCALR